MKDTMLAAVFTAPGKLELQQVPVPKIQAPDQVLLKVLAASICGTDLHILHVPPGHPGTVGSILCHEYVGEVLEVGSAVTEFAIGDHVVVDPNLTCGSCCNYCKNGMPNMCSNMTTLGIFMDGGFAEYNVAPARALHKISKDVPPEIAVFAEPLSCVVNATQKIKLQPGETAVVLGAGPIGLYFTQIFKASGAGKIIVAEISSFRQHYARVSGADVVVNPAQENLVQIVQEHTGGLGADVVVDAVGTLLKDAIQIARRGGRILLFGQNQNARAEIAQNDITRNELTIMGSFIAKYTFPPTIKLIESGILPLEKLITHRLPLREIEQGFDAMRRGEAIEVVIFPHQE
ncbi:zinc-dependent alcohol dehydrogenase family protein [Desulfurispora thermophila]|uniref:zinc-dependent alcohol dehydrogenase family protein n=1 Tax=Desulfurispora thermophila TaxID=265470 RepID=UPI00035D0F06|nr:zinc-dependent alcohol dehydrogenase family protein [Desulfurispora thermophila]